jgi:hypothetical protein
MFYLRINREMREKGMSDQILLWLDFETTGLKPLERDIVLEVGWVVTDADLVQLTPLRQRYAELKPCGVGEDEIAPTPDSGRWVSHRFDVRTMHDQSRLAMDWTANRSDELYSWRLIRHGAALEQLICEDIASAFDDMGPAEVMLAGLGVSHFDQSLLGYHCPTLAPRDENGRLHYATFDASVAGRVLNLPKCSKELLLALSTAGEVKADGITHETGGWSLEKAREHRADDDVAMGLIYARWLRARSL